MHRIASEQGGKAAVARYRALQASAPGEYDFAERGLNVLGYALPQEGKADAAVTVFRLMVESFPESANAYDSFGEALAAAGRRDEAVRAYERSLELDPKNRTPSRC